MRRLSTDTILPGMKLRLIDLDGVVVRFGVIATSRVIAARWRKGELYVTVPPGTTTSFAVRKLVDMKDRIMARRPCLRFADGQHLDFNGFTADIKRQSLHPLKVTLTGERTSPVVSVGTGLSFDDDEVTSIISRLLCVAATTVAPEVLLPRARDIAARLGLSPAGWKISRGHRTLGTCSSQRVIGLSAVNMFLPPELRDYIICHELAHLSEMNHSPRFHALCDRYCGGRERQLIRQLKDYNWPILRQ